MRLSLPRLIDWGLRRYEGEQDVEWPTVEYAPMPGLPVVTVPAMTCPLGLEPTPEAYIGHLILCLREWRRVLRDDGTCWVNLGDSYAGSWGNYGARKGNQRSRIADRWHRPAYEDPKEGWDGLPPTASVPGLKNKNLCGIPWRFAFAAQADGFYLRSDVIWHKPNPMPESVTDRPTKAHEYLFLLSKQERYYYDAEAIKEPAQVWTGQAARFERTGPVSEHVIPGQTAAQHRPNRNGRNAFRGQGSNRDSEGGKANREGWDLAEVGTDPTRNRRSVWTIAEPMYRLRDDLTPEQRAYVLRRIVGEDCQVSSGNGSSST
jgi:hypothetical protein